MRSELSSILNQAVTKREVASNNIVNQMTPEYKAKRAVFEGDSDFKKTLNMSVTKESHIPLKNTNKSGVELVSDSTNKNLDGNNVDVNKEMIEIIKENQVFSLGIRAINSHYEKLNAARGM